MTPEHMQSDSFTLFLAVALAMFVIALDLRLQGLLCTKAYSILFCCYTENLVGVPVLARMFK